MLTDVLDIGCLRKELVNLVADTQLVTGLEIPPSKLLLDTSKHLESAGILCLAGFLGNVFLAIEDTAFENGSAATGEIAWLDAMLKVDTLNDGLAAFCREGYAVGRLLGTETPVDQWIVNELEEQELVDGGE
jgi:hypothetical protein